MALLCSNADEPNCQLHQEFIFLMFLYSLVVRMLFGWLEPATKKGCQY